MKKLLALLMAIAMLVSIVACGGGSKEKDNVVDTNNPILNATANLLNKLASEGGTITLSVEGDAMDMLEQQFGLSFESLVFATDTKQVQATLNGKIGNTKLSESIYYGNQNLVVNAPSILGGAYGINLGSFDKDFANSIFNPESNSDFAIDEETMAQIEEVITSLKQVMSGEATESIPGLDTEAMAATITKVAETLMAEIEKIYPTETTEKDGYTTQTITITDDKISEVFEVVAKLLEDKEVKGLLETIGETLKEYTKSEIPFD
ncbi:MAG: hypothetical protein E7599_06425, partial [Ruminococcaceae bacterium]|nr:hypothetical protein [Oscillospiraceae bacterium]